MATESPIRILDSADKWPTLKQSTRYGSSSAKTAIEDFGLFLKGRRFQSFEKDIIPSRSESAPPSMEGSVAAIENMCSQQNSDLHLGLVHTSISSVNSETDLLFHVNLLSSSSHISESSLDKSFDGGIDGKMTLHARSSGESLRLHRSGHLPAHEEESEDDRSSEHSASAFLEKASSLGHHRSSLDVTQEYLQQVPSSSFDRYSLSCKLTEEAVVAEETHVDISSSVSAAVTNASTPEDVKQNVSCDPRSTSTNVPNSNDTGQVSSCGSSRSVMAKFDRQDNLPAGRVSGADKTHNEDVNNVNRSSSLNSESHKEQLIPQATVLHKHASTQQPSTSQVQGLYSQVIYPGLGHSYGSLNHFQYGPSNVSTSEIQPLLQPSGYTPPLYTTTAAFPTSPSPFYANLQPSGFFTPQYTMGGYAFNSALLPSYLAGYPSHGAVSTSFDNASFPKSGVPGRVSLHAYDMNNMQKLYGQVGNPVNHPFTDAFHLQYFQQHARNSYGYFDPQTLRGSAVGTQVNSQDSRKSSELVGLSNAHRPPHSAGASYGDLNVRNNHTSGHYSFRSPTNMLHFPAASVVSPVAQAKYPGQSNVPGGRYNMSHSNTLSGNPSTSFGFHSQGLNEINSYSFLEELKSGKGRKFELADITGQIGEFSVDQHGSRFIQQKLETCSDEEKVAVFKEAIPLASKLITDVFGNYVIQKLFDYGSPEQRRNLADQLEGQILPLSLQMYGCRVIQKALEVIDLKQKTRLVKELDGHVMRCIRDQNGNHVIQKCIESIPSNDIYFIISSFRCQVASLSMHPYGCRVIQRVLEHCDDEQLTQFIVDEILDSVCTLAQDQYGNYVTQHVLERGTPRERSEIIQKLAGSVVQLSQHKFASNVVEKCLEYCDASARDMLIKEITDDGDKSDNLLIMVKDQYANYVIQKILQKCTSEQRQMLLGLIRNHLSTLKKYTYGKHIVARFEQLSGEEIQSSGSQVPCDI